MERENGFYWVTIEGHQTIASFNEDDSGVWYLCGHGQPVEEKIFDSIDGKVMDLLPPTREVVAGVKVPPRPETLWYITKCRCCGNHFEWYGSARSSISYLHFYKAMSDKITYPSLLYCANCDGQTAQDVIKIAEDEE